jgi:hypothetical protein
MKHLPVPSAFASRRGLLKTSRLGVGERVVAGFIGRRRRHLYSLDVGKKFFGSATEREEIQCEILHKTKRYRREDKKNAFFKTQQHRKSRFSPTKTSTGKNNDIPRSAIFGGAGYSTFRRFHSRRRRRVFFCFFFVFFHLVPSRFGNRYERARPSLHVLEAAERVTDSAANNESV